MMTFGILPEFLRTGLRVEMTGHMDTPEHMTLFFSGRRYCAFWGE